MRSRACLIERVQPTAEEGYRPPPVLLRQLQGVFKRQAKAADKTARALLLQELDEVIRQQEEARDGRSRLALRLLQALHCHLGPAMNRDRAQNWPADNGYIPNFWAVRVDDDPPCFLNLDRVRDWAVCDDDLLCFLYANANRVPPHDSKLQPPPMTLAAKYGAVSILQHGARHADEFHWDATTLCYAAHFGDVRALDPILRAGCEPCNAALSIAASRGHLACVRYLHGRGFPLWDRIVFAEDSGLVAGLDCSFSLSETCLVVPAVWEDADLLWGVMRYGQIHGLPLSGLAACVVAERREKARTVLLCFHSAARRSAGAGEHAHVWGAMADVPLDVLYIILEHAQLELVEAFKAGAL